MASIGTRSLNPPASLNPLFGSILASLSNVMMERGIVDKSVTVCRQCGTTKPYESRNTSDMATHLKRHHPGVKNAAVHSAKQPLITAAFKQPLAAQSDRAKAITNAIGLFIAADMRPYSVVQNKGFKHMLKSVGTTRPIDYNTNAFLKNLP